MSCTPSECCSTTMAESHRSIREYAPNALAKLSPTFKIRKKSLLRECRIPVFSQKISERTSKECITEDAPQEDAKSITRGSTKRTGRQRSAARVQHIEKDREASKPPLQSSSVSTFVINHIRNATRDKAFQTIQHDG